MAQRSYRETAPVIVAEHHHVLRSWAALRRRLSTPPSVLTLDYHTDIMPCAVRGMAAPLSTAWHDPAAVDDAASRLRHDEHFDWALRAGIISRAVIVSLTPAVIAPAHPALEVRHAPSLPDADTILNRPEMFRAAADRLLGDDFLRPQLTDVHPDREPWILDIDCDFFLTAAAAGFAPDSRFAALAQQAVLVTLSRESAWVRLLRLPGETITGESLASSLAERIASLRGAR